MVCEQILVKVINKETLRGLSTKYRSLRTANQIMILISIWILLCMLLILVAAKYKLGVAIGSSVGSDLVIPANIFFGIAIVSIALFVFGLSQIGSNIGISDSVIISDNCVSVLIVVDVQRDFCLNGALAVPNSESLIQPLNETIKVALQSRIRVVYTRDWHPITHSSFEEFGGPWQSHCVQGTKGAMFHKDLYIPHNPIIINVGEEVESLGYSVFEAQNINPNFQSKNNKIFVTGIALEYCIMETCLDSVQRGYKVVAIDPLIRSISQENNTIAGCWYKLTKAGVVRTNDMALYV